MQYTPASPILIANTLNNAGINKNFYIGMEGLIWKIIIHSEAGVNGRTAISIFHWGHDIGVTIKTNKIHTSMRIKLNFKSYTSVKRIWFWHGSDNHACFYSEANKFIRHIDCT